MIFGDGTSHSEIFGSFFLCLEVLEKLQKVTISFVMSVCPAVHQHGKFGSYGKDFHEILYLRIFRKYVEKIQV